MSSTPLLLLGLGASAYYLYNQQKASTGSGTGSGSSEQTEVKGVLEKKGSCPDGYLLSDDGTECNLIDSGEPFNPCEEGYVISEDGKQCLPLDGSNPCGSDDFKLSEDGKSCVAKNPCGEGFILSADGKECISSGNPCGDPCFKYENDNCTRIPNCGSVTGSDIGDQFLYLGESIVAGEIYDFLGRKVLSVAERTAEKALAKEASEKLAKEIADKKAVKFAEAMAKKTAEEQAEALAKRTAREQARKALQTLAQREAGELLAKRATAVATKRLGIEALTIAGRKLATKVAVMVAKINAQNATGIGVVMSGLTAIALALSIGLAVAGVTFDKDDPKDWDWDNLPVSAQVALEAIPLFGDMISIISPFVAFKSGCATGLVEQNGLCYEPPKDGWECEAFLCTPKSSTYAPGFSPLSETKLHMTKRVELDTGTIPDTPPDGATKEGAFAYYVRQGWHLVGGTQWANCPDGWVDDGALCRNPIVCDPCPAGWIDDGLLCREPITLGGCNGDEVDDGLFCRVPLRGGDVHTVCEPIGCHSLDDCVWGRGCGCWGGGCNTWSDPITGGSSRAKPSWGGTVNPKNCRGGEVNPKPSEVLAPHSLECPANRSTNIAGLCYENPIRDGYERQSLGLLSQKAPPDREEWKSYPMFYGTVDIGVSFQKASYTRPPFPIFSLYGKRKREPEPPPADPPLPSLCSSLPARAEDFIMTTENREVCRVTDCGADSELSGDGLYCIKKCNEGFSYNFTNKMCEKILGDGTKDAYDNSAGVFEVEYDYY
jgi:hypothetical protein